jgi:hypothetical protein
MGFLDYPRLRGQCLTFIARGDAQMPLTVLVKTAQTYVRKGRLSVTEIGAMLKDVQIYRSGWVRRIAGSAGPRAQVPAARGSSLKD